MSHFFTIETLIFCVKFFLFFFWQLRSLEICIILLTALIMLFKSLAYWRETRSIVEFTTTVFFMPVAGMVSPVRTIVELSPILMTTVFLVTLPRVVHTSQVQQFNYFGMVHDPFSKEHLRVQLLPPQFLLHVTMQSFPWFVDVFMQVRAANAHEELSQLSNVSLNGFVILIELV